MLPEQEFFTSWIKTFSNDMNIYRNLNSKPDTIPGQPNVCGCLGLRGCGPIGGLFRRNPGESSQEKRPAPIQWHTECCSMHKTEKLSNGSLYHCSCDSWEIHADVRTRVPKKFSLIVFCIRTLNNAGGNSYHSRRSLLISKASVHCKKNVVWA